MRIIKDSAALRLRDIKGDKGKLRMPCYDQFDTIEIKLDDFREWYYQVHYRKGGGQISYLDVPVLIQEWLESAVFMSTDLEGKK
jgi:hypothetical protein